MNNNSRTGPDYIRYDMHEDGYLTITHGIDMTRMLTLAAAGKDIEFLAAEFRLSQMEVRKILKEFGRSKWVIDKIEKDKRKYWEAYGKSVYKVRKRKSNESA